MKSIFLKVCYLIGFAADLAAVLPLVFWEAGKAMFGLQNYNVDSNYLYVSRVAASLMLGWSLLLLWASFKPVERKGILLLTIFPVLTGLIVSSIITVATGFIKIIYVLPLWIFYAIIIPLYIIAYFTASKLDRNV